MLESNINDRLYSVIRSSVDIMVEKEINIDMDSDLIEDLGFDSVHIIMYVVGIEQEFGIAIPDEMLDFEKLSKVGSMSSFLINYFEEQEHE